MKEEALKKAAEETADWAYIKELPETIHSYQLRHLRTVYDDIYDLYTYVDEAAHRSATVYFHAETEEYKVRVQIGSYEYCLREFIVPKLEDFEQLLRTRFNAILQDIMDFHSNQKDIIFEEKHIWDWPFAATLPERLEEFELFIRPSRPFRFTNGSYIILDYEHFASKSNFAIYYNVFRDEYFGDERIAAVPDTDYDFDSRTLEELQEKIALHLAPRLKTIRERAQVAPDQNHG